MKFTNIGYKPINLELAGFRFKSRCCFDKEDTIVELSMQSNNLYPDKLPKLLNHGDSFIYVTKWNSFLDLCRQYPNRNLCIYACISAFNKEVLFKLDRNLLDKIKKECLEQ